MLAQVVGWVVPLPGVRDPGGLGSQRRHLIHNTSSVKVVGHCNDRFGQAGLVRGHQPLDVLAQVIPEVPAVGDLNRVGCTIAGAVGARASAVSADHFHAWVVA